MSGWPVTRVDRVATVKARIGWKALTADEYQDDGYVFLNTPNIKGVDIDFEDVNYISQFRWDESPELQLRNGDVLLAKDGNTLGITQVVRELPRPATVNGSIAVIRPRSMESRFLRYVLAAAPIQSRIDELRTGMGVPHLFQWDINRLPLTEPPIDEQQRIADFLDDHVARLDEIASARSDQIVRLIERRQQAIDSMARGDDPLRRLRSIVSLLRDGTHQPPPRVADGVPLLTAKNLRGHRLALNSADTFISPDDADQLDRTLAIRAGDVLLSIKGTVGSAAVVPVEFPRFQIERNIALMRADPELVDPQWLYWHLRATQTRAQMSLSMGFSAQPGIYLGTLADLQISVPDLPEQSRRLMSLQDVTSACESAEAALTRSIDLLNEYKRSLITAAVTGEFDVTTARTGVPA